MSLTFQQWSKLSAEHRQKLIADLAILTGEQPAMHDVVVQLVVKGIDAAIEIMIGAAARGMNEYVTTLTPMHAWTISEAVLTAADDTTSRDEIQRAIHFATEAVAEIIGLPPYPTP